MIDPDRFIRANTRLTAPSAVPELQLWLADELTPLWQATESWLADPGRTYLPAAKLEALATYLIPVTYNLESVTERKTTLYKLIA